LAKFDLSLNILRNEPGFLVVEVGVKKKKEKMVEATGIEPATF
jgi:hypothetical protein